jgi:16S rRNA (cytidine1402-2'-O)-methyltransferase
MPASLFVVSTPIGNLDDITLRALATLKSVSLIAAEDTRRTSTLLRHFGITTPATSLHEHNERQKLPQLLQKLKDGQDIALVSDAGTPLVADPGQRLISAAIEAGIKIIPIPGPSAVLAAMSVSGFPADDFVFAGFAPSRSNDRLRWLEAFVNESRPVVFFEAPHRIHKTLTDLPTVLGERPITLCRELTKLHEEVIRTSTTKASLLQVLDKGEFTLVIGPKSAVADVKSETVDDEEIARHFYRLTETDGLMRRVALTQTARKFGLSTKYVYRTIEKLKAAGRRLDRDDGILLP